MQIYGNFEGFSESALFGLGFKITRWWFPIFFIFTPKVGEMIHFDDIYNIFLMGGSTTTYLEDHPS